MDDICTANKTKIGDHEKRLDKIDIILEKVRNRPPIWATFVMSGLLGAVGYLVAMLRG